MERAQLAAVFAGCAYEAVAIVTPLPTISTLLGRLPPRSRVWAVGGLAAWFVLHFEWGE